MDIRRGSPRTSWDCPRGRPMARARGPARTPRHARRAVRRERGGNDMTQDDQMPTGGEPLGGNAFDPELARDARLGAFLRDNEQIDEPDWGALNASIGTRA